MEYILNKDYFHTCSPEVRYLYIPYTLCGGIYYEGYMKIWFRYFWSFLNSCSTLLIVYNCTIALLQVESHEISLLFTSGAYLVAVFSILLINLSTYYWRKHFNAIFEFINAHGGEGDANENDGEKYNDYRITNFDALFRYFPKVIISTEICVLLAKLLRSFYNNRFGNSSFTIDCIQDYMYPFLMVESPSPIIYIIVCVLQAITITIYIIPSDSILLLLYTMSVSTKNQAIILKRRIKAQGDFFFEKIEQSFANEREILASKLHWELKQKKLMTEQKIREKYSKEFYANLRQWIRSHQELTTFMNLIKGYLAIMFQICIPCASLVLLFFGYQLRKMVSDSAVINFEYFIVVLLVSVFLLIICWIGNILAEVNDELAAELYNSPWYYLPPTERRVFLTFLSLTQRSATLHLFKLYPVTLSLFPTIWNKTFEFVRLISIMEKKN